MRPYFGLRSYTDEGFCLICIDMRRDGRDPRQAWPDYQAHWDEVHAPRPYDGQLGSEATPQEFLAALWECTAEWVRVLKPEGSIFVNLGDKYAGGGMGGHGGATLHGGHYKEVGMAREYKRVKVDAPSKSLLGLPWRYALGCMDQTTTHYREQFLSGLLDDVLDGTTSHDIARARLAEFDASPKSRGLGLILRAEIIWGKPNGLPESVTDRVRRSHEQVFHFTRQPRYYAAVDEIREPAVRTDVRKPAAAYLAGVAPGMRGHSGLGDRANHALGTLPGSVWNIPSQPLQVPARLNVSHFAAYPTELPRRIIAGWSPPGVCTACGQGRRPVTDVDWSKVPHTITEKRALTAQEAAGWCAEFADWCDGQGITRNDLDAAAGTSDMGGWWKSRLPHRAAVPTPDQWAKVRAMFGPPASLDALVHLVREVPAGLLDAGSNVRQTGRHRTTGGGLSSSSYLAITGYACACPDTTAPTRPAIVLDPFCGTGTTMLTASVLGRIGVGVDRSRDYCRLAQWRCSDPGERCRVIGAPKPPPVADGQDALFSIPEITAG